MTQSTKKAVFEITGAGFDGSADETDDRVFWVQASSRDEVVAAMDGFGAKFHGYVESLPESDIDFVLPGDEYSLKVELSRCCAHRSVPMAEYVFGCFRYGSKTLFKSISILADSKAVAREKAIKAVNDFESVRYIEAKPNPEFIANREASKLWFDTQDARWLDAARKRKEREDTPVLAVSLRLEFQGGISLPGEQLTHWVRGCLNCNRRHMLAHVELSGDARPGISPMGASIIDLDVNLRLKRCDPFSPPMTQEEYLSWISNCLNCNTNRVSVDVTLRDIASESMKRVEPSETYGGASALLMCGDGLNGDTNEARMLERVATVRERVQG